MVERAGTFNRGSTSLKEAIARREKQTYKRAKINEYEYMDGMAESLNKEIKANVDPYWRNHASLKGWCSMNYPTTVTNPLLKKHQEVPAKQESKQDTMPVKFSNHERPYSCPQVPLARPFSSHLQSGLKFQPTRILSKAGMDKISSATIASQLEQKLKLGQSQALPENDGASAAGENPGTSRLDMKPSMMSVAESAAIDEDPIVTKPLGMSAFKATQSGISQASLCFGKSIHNSNFRQVANSTINTVEKHVEGMEMPKKFRIAKKKADLAEKKAKIAEEKAAREAIEAAGGKAPKKARANKFAYPTPDPLPPPKDLTVAEAMGAAQSWNHANVISKKYAVGTLTTANHNEKAAVFQSMNQQAEMKGSMYPQSQYFGRDLSQTEDRFNTRSVKALNDISFEEDSDWEDNKNLKRMPRTILNEENLREFLSEATLRLNLENHYWIKNNFIDKIGRMAPNIQVLSLRRMKFITNPVFAEIFKYMKKLERIDLTDCDGLLPSACNLLIDNNRTLAFVQLSGCNKGVNDEVMSNIASCLQDTLSFLDISYCKNVTDAGLEAFEGKTYPLDSLVINAVHGITAPAIKKWLESFKDTLLDFEAALNDQEGFNAVFFETLGQCYNLETVDVTGCPGITDDAGRLISAATVQVGNESIKPGLQYAHTLKVSGSTIGDVSMPQIVKTMPNLEHVELCKCESVGEFGVQQLLQNCAKLAYLDINKVPIVNYGFLDELKQSHPELLIRRNRHQDEDFKKDNGLRVPRRIIEKKKKKKKKKGKKKK